MSYLTQMVGLAVQNFVSAAVGLGRGGRASSAAWCAAGRPPSATSGSTSSAAWSASCSRSRVVVHRRAGEPGRHPDAPRPERRRPPLEGATQSIPGGPFASQEAIKELGTNGGGSLNANSAHPLSNPNGLHRTSSQMGAILLIPFALTYAFGRMVEGPEARAGSCSPRCSSCGPAPWPWPPASRSAATRRSTTSASTSPRRSPASRPAGTWRARRSASARPPPASSRPRPRARRPVRSSPPTTASPRWAAPRPSST